jgi:hypothetical protein
MNCYLMTWSGSNVNTQTILDALDKLSEIVNWRSATGGIFIVSDTPPNDLSELINNSIPKHVHFVLARLRIGETWGYTDEKTWEFIRRPRRAGEP